MIEIPTKPKLASKRGRAPLFICIAVPTHDMVPAKTMHSYGNLCAFTGATLVADGVADIVSRFYFGTYIDKSREELAAEALRNGCTHILYLDSDMTFPKDLLIRLLNHNLPIVGVNYSGRRIPAKFVAVKKIGGPGEGEGERCPTFADSTGLEEVEGIGFGAVLIQTRVFQNLSRPFFHRKWDEEEQRWIGEDIYFCRLARENGYRVFVDHDLSKEIGHMGQLKFLVDHAQDIWETEHGIATDHELQQPTGDGR